MYPLMETCDCRHVSATVLRVYVKFPFTDSWNFVLWWRYCGLVYKFFLINNIELKCSFVRCRKYHKSWSNGAAELHISLDLLCGTTAAELHNSEDLLCYTTAAEQNNSVNLLCGTTTAEVNPIWCMHQDLQTFSKDSDETCWKICRLNPT